ncbi:hypothetical protein TI39_contig302g00037 [Zymoseptoria brevis]|uniref:Uncharacterized protein n=1 Tax=Zymoseptoria brevis TaxID=1047168 RepID=A0A0F4GUP9_9PEZI|nr:hypothetical protein TI39_contig302g00037 [Zymoseptoria brevis]
MTLDQPTFAGGDRKRKVSSTEDFVPLHRPFPQLRGEQGSLGSDWGIGGNRRASTGTLLLPERSALFGGSPPHDHAAILRTDARTPTTPFQVDIWEFGSAHDGRNETEDEIKRKRRSPSYGKPSSADLALPSIEATAIDWVNMQDDLSWWQPEPPQDETHLGLPRPDPQDRNRGQSQHPFDLHPAPDPCPHLARTSQSRPPPQLQLPGNTPRTLTEPENTQTRRQAVQLPRLDTDTNSNDALYDFLIQPAMSDDMARLLASRPPPEDLMPSTSHVTPWWDVNDEISAMLSQAGDVLSHPHPENFDVAANALVLEEQNALIREVTSPIEGINLGSASMATIQLPSTSTITTTPLAAPFTATAAAATSVDRPDMAIVSPAPTIGATLSAHDSSISAALTKTMPRQGSMDHAARKDLVGNFYW